jgi:hypothetical protein
MLPWKVGVANIPQDVRVQGVTTIRLFGSRRLPSLWRSSITFRCLVFKSSTPLSYNEHNHNWIYTMSLSHSM